MEEAKTGKDKLLEAKLLKEEENRRSQPQQHKQRPEAVVFASFYNAKQTSARSCCLSGRWRRQERTKLAAGLSTRLSHPALAHKHRFGR
uniref:Uncharacterized protein n=1 Tax=Macrostomum lignano TaxID=282301 RepID=A0A1I8FH65_9PLAT